MYRGHPSVQWVERSQTAQIRNGILLWRTRGRMSGRHGGDKIEVLWVEDIAGYKSDRICLPRRSEEFVSEVREFCKYNTSK